MTFKQKIVLMRGNNRIIRYENKAPSSTNSPLTNEFMVQVGTGTTQAKLRLFYVLI